eukprot:m.58776 g.58776  ORF g.58776 m.58776 type:complete len:206 (-) comp13532_c0_seq5:714-1331(-)
MARRLLGIQICAMVVWLVLAIIAWIMIVAALSREEWVEGTDVNTAGTSRKMEVGLFRQCTAGSCSDVSVSDMNVDTWKGAGILFIIAIILLSIAIILGFVTIFVDILLPWTKLTLSLANLVFMVAIFLIPIGFAWLDDTCPSGNDQAQCGLICNGGGNMDFFKLCSPYEVGAALWVMVVGLIVLFVGSWVLASINPFQGFWVRLA